jgi:flagellar biosynthetic protein FlhB
VASKEQKKFKPTQRRKREARRSGQNARSSEVPVAFTMLSLLIGFQLVAPPAARVVADGSRTIFGAAGTLEFHEVATLVMGMLGFALLPFLAMSLVAGFVAGVSQVGFTVAPKAAKPKWKNLSIKKGIERFKPARMGWELVRSVAKLGLLTLILWEPLTSWIPLLAAPIGIGASLEILSNGIWDLIARAAFLAVLIAGVDFAVNKRRTLQEIRMTREEMKEELKHAEGDPTLKSRRRARHQALSRNRMIAQVGRADVLLTNPTRLAVALRYDTDDPAPKVLAKGSGRFATALRAEARRHGVPVIEDKPLARALFRLVEVGGWIPAQLFEAVAAVLAVVYRRRGRVVA